ncbi:hypothetical protein [Treponema sp. R80B11-R83G3]
MNREEFSKKYFETVERTIKISEKLKRKEKINEKYREKDIVEFEDDVEHEIYYWDFTDEIDKKTAETRDVFEYGLQLIDDYEWDFVSDDNEREFIDKTLSNIVEQEKDEYARTLKRIQKEAVLMILERKEPKLIYLMLNSFTDFKLDEPMLIDAMLNSISDFKLNRPFFVKSSKDSLDFDILKD